MKFNYSLFSQTINKSILLKQVELNKKLSIRECAAQIGISHSTLFRAMSNQKLDIDNILLICDWSNKQITEFILL